MIHIDPKVDTFQTGHCWGAFGAIQEMSRIASDNGMMLGICAPADSSRTQFIRVFYKYVNDHPEWANRPFGQIARLALARAFPCGR
ncbi:MAG: Rap1a/Tai family immunity protein [Candidatus Binataceae bacterium]